MNLSQAHAPATASAAALDAIAYAVGPSAMRNGARAVATACAANAMALGIPCHRVLRADGSPSGYRWSLERKRALLDREAAI